MKKQKSEISYQKSAISNEKGIALVMVMILSLIALSTMAGLVYMVTSGTQTSGMQKRYKSALEVAKGAKDITDQVINYKAYDTDMINFMTDVSGTITTPPACGVKNTADLLPDGTTCGDHVNDCVARTNPSLCVKETLPSFCWISCSTSLTIDPSDPSSYDMSFVFNDYTAYVKLVDVTFGNTSPTTEYLGDGKGVVETGAGNNEFKIPFGYSTEIVTVNTNNPDKEQARLSVLYQF